MLMRMLINYVALFSYVQQTIALIKTSKLHFTFARNIIEKFALNKHFVYQLFHDA